MNFFDKRKDTKFSSLGIKIDNYLLKGFENQSIIYHSDDQDAITDTSYENNCK